MVVWKVGEEYGYGKTGEDEKTASQERSFARVEEAGKHTILIRPTLILSLLHFLVRVA